MALIIGVTSCATFTCFQWFFLQLLSLYLCSICCLHCSLPIVSYCLLTSTSLCASNLERLTRRSYTASFTISLARIVLVGGASCFASCRTHCLLLHPMLEQGPLSIDPLRSLPPRCPYQLSILAGQKYSPLRLHPSTCHHSNHLVQILDNDAKNVRCRICK